jgi:hypothetical protein
MKNVTMLCVLALFLVTTCPQAQEATLAVEVTGNDQLVQEKGRFKDTRVHPDADFTRYSKLYLSVAELQFREVEAGPAETSGTIDDTRQFGLSKEEQERYRTVVTAAFADELGRSKKLQVVDDVGPNTLIVRASVLDIVSYIPPSSVGLVDVYPSTVGEATLRFELIDSETGVIQARFEERSEVLPPGRIMHEVSPVPVSRQTMWRDVDRWSRKGASDLRKVLKKAQSGHGLK